MSLQMNNKHRRQVYSTHITINFLVMLPAVLQIFVTILESEDYERVWLQNG